MKAKKLKKTRKKEKIEASWKKLSNNQSKKEDIM